MTDRSTDIITRVQQLLKEHRISTALQHLQAHHLIEAENAQWKEVTEQYFQFVQAQENTDISETERASQEKHFQEVFLSLVETLPSIPVTNTEPLTAKLKSSLEPSVSDEQKSATKSEAEKKEKKYLENVKTLIGIIGGGGLIGIATLLYGLWLNNQPKNITLVLHGTGGKKDYVIQKGKVGVYIPNSGDTLYGEIGIAGRVEIEVAAENKEYDFLVIPFGQQYLLVDSGAVYSFEEDLFWVEVKKTSVLNAPLPASPLPQTSSNTQKPPTITDDQSADSEVVATRLIAGRVMNEDQIGLDSIKVILIDPNTKEDHVAYTDEHGSFKIQIPKGNMTVCELNFYSADYAPLLKQNTLRSEFTLTKKGP